MVVSALQSYNSQRTEGVRIVWITGYSASDLGNVTKRTDYVSSLVDLVQSTFTDGINLDFEDPILANTPEYYLLTSLVQDIRYALNLAVPGAQFTFDIAWSPDCIDNRCYDWVGLAANTDFLLIMGYDLESQMFTPNCVASPNSPYDMIWEGIFKFMTGYGISPNQLVLGVPWYGYDYECLNHNSTTESVCVIQEVPYLGVNCSDAAGRELDYADIMQILQNSTTGRMWDEKSKSVWMNFIAPDGTIHQMWYDDPVSLAMKYALQSKLSLRGLSMWHMDALYYGNDQSQYEQTVVMWDTMAKYDKDK